MWKSVDDIKPHVLGGEPNEQHDKDKDKDKQPQTEMEAQTVMEPELMQDQAQAQDQDQDHHPIQGWVLILMSLLGMMTLSLTLNVTRV